MQHGVPLPKIDTDSRIALLSDLSAITGGTPYEVIQLMRAAFQKAAKGPLTREYLGEFNNPDCVGIALLNLHTMEPWMSKSGNLSKGQVEAIWKQVRVMGDWDKFSFVAAINSFRS